VIVVTPPLTGYSPRGAETGHAWAFSGITMGVETPIPPKTMNAAAPGRKPPRRIKAVEYFLPIFMLWV
jgi:hypothetical protein